MSIGLDEVSEFRLSFCRDLGLKIKDEQFFLDKIRTYGYREIVSQYWTHFSQEDDASDSFKLNASFEQLYDFYELDQHLKNEALIDLQLFEQSFKVALTDVVEIGSIPLKVEKAKKGQDDDLKLDDILKEQYRLQSGHVIRRGDLRSRIRRIKENYLEPYEGYNQLYQRITPWVLIKEMSFGVACNYFFLLHHKMQIEVLKILFKKQIDIIEFEKIVEIMRSFRNRAAHNYRLIGMKYGDRPYYQLLYQKLLLLSNEEPATKMKSAFEQIKADYLSKHPEEERYLAILL